MMIPLEISKAPIELCKVLKLAGMTSSGGAAKSEIAGGRVLVNGSVETRKRKKISVGDIVEFGDARIRIYVRAES